MAKETGNDVAVPAIPRLSDEELREYGTMDEALARLTAQFGGIVTADEEIGTGFELIDSDRGKTSLVGVPMLLIAWTFTLGDYGEFVTIFAMTGDGRKVIVNDGSTGIREQLAAYTERTGRQNAMQVKHGLRVSRYEIDADSKRPVNRNHDGPTEPAQTFYLDTSA